MPSDNTLMLVIQVGPVPKLRPDSPDDVRRCDRCPPERLDAARSSEASQLLRRSLDLRAALNMGVPIGLDEILAGEFAAMQVIEEKRDRYECERAKRA